MKVLNTADSFLAELQRLGEGQNYAAIDVLLEEQTEPALRIACREWSAGVAAHQADMGPKAKKLFARAEARVRKFFDELETASW